ncbi:MAG TPA: CBS domain-containing protein, partial [Thermoanaerobaculia bacterium]|nr:CBS domain-containing protein [Thermoanaerobaculia bacterium]
MELITTHVSADFDALASVLVARRLHPGAAIFFPGSREESVRRMLETRGVAIEELRQRDVDPAALSRIILCDVRQRDRLGVVPEWLAANPEVEVLAYDHHPDTDSDVAVRGGVVDAAVGATSTLLAEQLRERGMTPSAEEATLLLMGIYEDTGSLTYPTTSPRDLTAAAWLLAQGGDMAVVRRHAVHSLDAVHLEVLYRMTQELQVTGVHGYRVGVVTLDLDGFIDELAPLVSRCLELFELDLLFALFGEGDRLTIIARGDVPGVHLGRVLEEVAGGGGHETAAAGSRKGVTVLEAREELLARLGDVVPPRTRARDLMIAPFVSVPLGATVAETKALLVRHAINAAPVVEGDRAVGAVSRQLLDGALQHGMETRPVSSIMRRELEWVDPQAPAEVLAERMAGQHPRFILVGDRDTARAQGVVTRMDVLRHLHGRLAEVAEPIERRSRELKARRQRIGGLLRDRVPAALLAKIETAAAVARRTGARVYLVGGLVRDLLLGQENRDLDLVVEGDGLAFAGELAQALGGRLRVHEAFLTAVVVLPDGDTVDIATARSEFYRAPAALPEVRTSALRQDLYRRDFTINTLAIHLGP